MLIAQHYMLKVKALEGAKLLKKIQLSINALFF